MANNNNLSPLILGFIFVILGAVLITVIVGQTDNDTNPTLVTDEVLDITAARLPSNSINETYYFTLAQAGLKDTDGWVTNSVYISNATQGIVGNYTVDYTNDRINFINNTYMVTGGGKNTNSTLVDYKYYQDSYLVQAFGRNTIKLIPGFLALLTLIGVLALLYVYLNFIRE